MAAHINTSHLVELRVRAEQRLGPRSIAQSSTTYELELARIAIDLQNEDLATTRDQLRRATARCRDLFDNAPLAYLALDGFGTIHDANQRACQLLAVHRGDVIASTLARFTTEDAAAQVRAQLAQSGSLDTHLVRSDGEVLPVRMQVVFADEMSFWVAITSA